MPTIRSIPGLKIRPAADGKTTWYWVASQLSRQSGAFSPRGAWLWHGIGQPMPSELEDIRNAAYRLSIDFWEWKAEWSADRAGKPRGRRGLIYFLQVGDKVKIGFTQDVERRISELQVASPFNLKLLVTIPGSLVTERRLQKRFMALRVAREWFRYEPPIIGFVERERQRTGVDRTSEPNVRIMSESLLRGQNESTT